MFAEYISAKPQIRLNRIFCLSSIFCLSLVPHDTRRVKNKRWALITLRSKNKIQNATNLKIKDVQKILKTKWHRPQEHEEHWQEHDEHRQVLPDLHLLTWRSGNTCSVQMSVCYDVQHVTRLWFTETFTVHITSWWRECPVSVQLQNLYHKTVKWTTVIKTLF